MKFLRCSSWKRESYSSEVLGQASISMSILRRSTTGRRLMCFNQQASNRKPTPTPIDHFSPHLSQEASQAYINLSGRHLQRLLRRPERREQHWPDSQRSNPRHCRLDHRKNEPWRRIQTSVQSRLSSRGGQILERKGRLLVRRQSNEMVSAKGTHTCPLSPECSGKG